MKVEVWKLSRIKPYEKNARKIPQSAVDSVARSLKEFGWRQPIVVDKAGVIVVGHVRRLGAIQNGMTEAPVHVASNLSAVQLKAYRLMDNRSHEEATWEPELLKAEMLELRALDLDLGITGFSSRELDAMLRPSLEGEDDAPPLPEEPFTKPGDLWTMGEHKLLCGDATNAEDVARLMNGEKAHLFATDPPYLVDYQGGNHPESWSNKPEVKDKHWDDYIDPSNAVEFYEAFLKLGLQHSIERVPVYQWHADLRRTVVSEAWKRAGLLLHQIIVWVKSRPVLTRSHFMWKHEPCAYGWVTKHTPVKPPGNETSIWMVDQIGESDGIHPTQKPVELCRKPIVFHTKPGQICYEPFSGSGTMIAACEVTQRRCFALEIAPAFVDVAVLRWMNLTGKQAYNQDGVCFPNGTA